MPEIARRSGPSPLIGVAPYFAFRNLKQLLLAFDQIAFDDRETKLLEATLGPSVVGDVRWLQERGVIVAPSLERVRADVVPAQLTKIEQLYQRGFMYNTLSNDLGGFEREGKRPHSKLYSTYICRQTPTSLMEGCRAPSEGRPRSIYWHLWPVSRANDAVM